MIEVKEQCKKCYHFQVCANILKQQLFIREKLGEENPSCEQFIPTADVVEVVRCKNCKHNVSEVCRHKFAMKYIWDNAYCPYGVRRSENEG